MSNIRWTRGQSPFSNPFTLNRVVEDFFRHAARQAEGDDEDVVQSTWTPAVDVRETDSALELYIEVPGVNRDDINISLEDNVLTVSGERHFAGDNRESYRRVERDYGRFSRTFRTPREVDGSQVTASCKDGVLHLELPKVEAARPRQIEIN